jgi:hypothetical protein
MSEIPRIPQVTPPSLVNSPVHRVDHAGDRQQPRKEHDPAKEDVLDLHDMEEPEQAEFSTPSANDDEDGVFDIAV